MTYRVQGVLVQLLPTLDVRRDLFQGGRHLGEGVRSGHAGVVAWAQRQGGGLLGVGVGETVNVAVIMTRGWGQRLGPAFLQTQSCGTTTRQSRP